MVTLAAHIKSLALCIYEKRPIPVRTKISQRLVVKGKLTIAKQESLCTLRAVWWNVY